jgi:hypothetical protein
VTPAENLFTTLRANEIDATDLSDIAFWHFHSAQDISPNEIIFGGSGGTTQYALKFVYKDKKLRQIHAGPTLTAEDIAAVQAKIALELSQGRPPRVATQVLFSRIAVDGVWKYRDVFQVLPIPNGSPRGHSLFGGNPFLVQFAFIPSSEPTLYASRRFAQAQRICLLLNALLKTDISMLRNPAFHWVRLPEDSGASRIAFCQEMYDYSKSGNFPDSGSFASVDGTAPLTAIEPREYYTRTITVNDPGQTLEIPSNLELLLDRFHSSTALDQDRFLRACFWLRHAQDVFGDSTSAGFTALVRAIESIMPQDKSAGTCPSCKRSIGRGSVARLTAFLDEFVPRAPKLQHARATLYYGLRSQLSHGGALTFRDRNPFGPGLTAEAIEEDKITREVAQLVRVTLVNWLHSRIPLLLTLAD